jgi:hypothetical protein
VRLGWGTVTSGSPCVAGTFRKSAETVPIKALSLAPLSSVQAILSGGPVFLSRARRATLGFHLGRRQMGRRDARTRRTRDGVAPWDRYAPERLVPSPTRSQTRGLVSHRRESEDFDRPADSLSSYRMDCPGLSGRPAARGIRACVGSRASKPPC